ncbi:PAS domain S-box protein [Undibacterium sp. Ji49W]|uniref:PAS domain S-box protein n=1 Tax=Undibacterium sp. Ji49W TaxID=3413040 RepID=UPI003BEFD749
MQAPALPHDEAIRLQTLQACAILDTPAEERFDRLTRLARHLFQTPIALVSLIDTDRQWFKSRQGLDATQTPRDISFCGHAILSQDVLYVPDARLDLRFSDNPLVTGKPNIRFYAGAPLRARNGQRLGTLCIIDSMPRTLSQDDIIALRDLADCVEHEFSREEQQRQHHALLALTEITSLSYQDPENLLRQALEMACDYLGIGTGHIVKVEDGMCEIVLRQSGDDRFHEGEKIPLSDSFASLTVNSNTVFHIADVFNSPYQHHPGYTQLGVVSYISVALYMNERQYGTLNFSDVHARLFPFSDVEIEFVRLLGDWVSGVLKRQELDSQLQQQRMLSDAIAQTQALFISESDQEKGFESLLAATLNLTGSECGFINEVLHDKQGEIVLKSTVLAWNTNNELTVGTPLVQDVQDQISQHLTTLFGIQKNITQATLLQTPALTELGIIFPEHLRPLRNFLGIPVHYDGELIAIVGIANRQHDASADDALIAFINPLFSTLGQLISAARVQKHRYETERQLANVIKGTNIGTWECNIVTGETIYNERWAEMLGYTLAELSPTTVDTWLNLCHPEDLKLTSALIEQHFRGEIEYFDLKSRMRHKDGRWIWIHDRGCVVSWSPDGQPLIMSGSHADITTQKEAEAELEHALELLEKSNAAARIGTWELDAQTRELHWSKVTRQIHEVDEDFSCTVEHAISFYKNEHYQQKITQMVGDALREGKAFDTELCIITARGNERCVHVIGFPQFENNVCLRLYGTFQDISERKAAEESLREHATQTSTIVDNVLDGIITLNEDEYILSVNNAAANIFGYTIDDLPGQHIRQLMPQAFIDLSDAPVTPAEITQASGKEELPVQVSGVKDIIGIGREITGRKKDGSLFPLDVSMSAVKRQGKPLYIGLMRDITERKRIEQIKNEFISTVSHELRTPLTSISGALGLISGGALGSFPDRIQQMLDIAIKNCLRLTFLINDLLDMEKLSAGKMVFHFQTVPLSDVLAQAIESNQTFGAQRHVSLRLAHPVPAVSISVDTQRFMQVLSNLLSNAIKYSPENGTVDITAIANERRVRINVIDHGAGVPNEFRDRIFQKFAQADSSDTRQNGGTGLGLAITRELVERMDGNIGFESRPGRGAKFYIDLPISHQDLNNRNLH